MKKDIEVFIRTKACSIYEKYYSGNPGIPLIEKKTIKQILSIKFAFS